MAFWRSSGRAFWLSLTLPACAGVSFLAGCPWVFIVVTLFAVPVLDWWMGQGAPVSGRPIEATSEQQIPCWFALAWILSVAIAASRAENGSWPQVILLIVGSGVLSATAMAHLHELTHRPGRKWIAITDLAFVVAGYPHYRFTHRLHHQHLGDARFGSTASVGTSVFRHVMRSYTAGLRTSFSTHAYQDRRIPLALFRNILGGVLLLAIAMTLHLWRVAVFYVGYSVVSVFIVEAIGYMQHYGLAVEEAVAPITSWDVNFWLSNCLLVNNGFHSSHHDDAHQPYYGLGEQQATLPGGYFQMLWLTFIPPLWFSVMDRRVKALADRARSRDAVAGD
jgi:alkane 1-monooxygenase